jgi:hypothetical protein
VVHSRPPSDKEAEDAWRMLNSLVAKIDPLQELASRISHCVNDNEESASVPVPGDQEGADGAEALDSLGCPPYGQRWRMNPGSVTTHTRDDYRAPIVDHAFRLSAELLKLHNTLNGLIMQKKALEQKWRTEYGLFFR